MNYSSCSLKPINDDHLGQVDESWKTSCARESFIRFSNARLQAKWFYCFRAFGNLMKPEARVFEMTSPKKHYKIMQCCIFPIFLSKALYVWFVVFTRHSLYLWAFVNYPIVSRCTKFVFQKCYELEVIYILFLPWPKEGFASRKQSRKKNFA